MVENGKKFSGYLQTHAIVKMIKVIQIEIMEWQGQDGKINQEVVGLGDDSNIYKWHRGTGKWILYVIQK